MSNKHPKTDHLKPYQFKQGWEGGPGRPRRIYTEAHNRVSEMTVADLQINPTDSVPLAMAKAAAREAIQGKIPAIAEIANRVEGTPTQRHEVSGPEGKPLLDLESAAQLIDQFYGLDGAPPPSKQTPALPVSESVDSRQLPAKDRGQS